MATIVELLPGVLGAGCITLLVWAIFGESGKAKRKPRGSIKQEIYRWDDRAAHRD